MATVRDLITDAYTEIGVVGGGDTLSAEDGVLGLSRLSDILDQWNARREAIYEEQFITGTLTPNLVPHTIGPSGATFTCATNRPVKLDACNLIFTNVSPTVRTPINVRDYNWWNANQVRGVTTSVPTDVYYEPSFPNGNLYFWPVPTVAYGVEFMCRLSLTVVTLNTTLSYPPGYKRALMLTLAEDLCGPLEVSLPPTLMKKATEARQIIFGNNQVYPSIRTADDGIPRGQSMGRRSDFNWTNGTVQR